MTSDGKLKIGMAGIWPYPIGGVAATCFNLSGQLAKQGHQVYFIDGQEGEEKRDTGSLCGYKILARLHLRDLWMLLQGFCGVCGKRIRRLLWKSAFEIVKSPYFRIHLKASAVSLLRVMEIGKWFDDKGIDILHGHHAGIFSWQVLMVARYLLNCPFVVTVYVSEFTMPSNHEMLPVAISVCDRADAIMCISKHTMAQMQKVGIQNNHVSVIYLACDQEHYTHTEDSYQESVRQKFNLYPRIPKILYVGWLIERKGPQVLMEALKQLVADPWQAVFVGPDHGLFNRLKDMADNLGIAERVRISSPLNQSDLLALYDLSDIFVFPTLSQDEGFGLVGLEALAHGKPVVASRTGAIPEVIGDAGLYFEPGNSAQLADRIHQLLVDENMRHEMSLAAIARSREFDWSKTASNVETLYKVAIEKCLER